MTIVGTFRFMVLGCLCAASFEKILFAEWWWAVGYAVAALLWLHFMPTAKEG